VKLDVDITQKLGDFSLNTKFKCDESALGIFGPSGCGKSTLFRAISGLNRPDSGHIRLDEKTLFDADQNIFTPPHKRNIGLVFQDARLFPHWTVEQNIRAGECINTNDKKPAYNFDDIVELLNIRGLIGRSIEDLSGGEKQRIAIGQTLLAHPRLLLMDEPVSGLDASLKMQILPFLAKVHKELKLPTVLISHDLGEILQLTDKLLLMRSGSIVGNDSLDKLVQNPETLQELKGAELTNLIRGRVRSHDESRGITKLDSLKSPDQLISIELATHLPVGSEISIGIAANQIALSTSKVENISMRNQIEGSIIQTVHATDRSICHLETKAGPLFVEITPGTAQDLKLSEGASIYALFKSMATQHL